MGQEVWDSPPPHMMSDMMGHPPVTIGPHGAVLGPPMLPTLPQTVCDATTNYAVARHPLVTPSYQHTAQSAHHHIAT